MLRYGFAVDMPYYCLRCLRHVYRARYAYEATLMPMLLIQMLLTRIRYCYASGC